MVFAAPSPTGRKPGSLARLARYLYQGCMKGYAMEDDGILTQLVAGTPSWECCSVIARLSGIWDKMAESIGIAECKFIKIIRGFLMSDYYAGEDAEDELKRWEEQPDNLKGAWWTQVVITGGAYACQGIKAQIAGDMLCAWKYVARARYWEGIAYGIWLLQKEQGNPAAAFARIGAAARHKENREMRREVEDWWKKHANDVSSKDAAAEKIAGTVVPVKFRTARNWLKGLDKP